MAVAHLRRVGARVEQVAGVLADDVQDVEPHLAVFIRDLSYKAVVDSAVSVSVASSSGATTRAMASNVAPPLNTARSRKNTCSAGVSSRKLHSIVAASSGAARARHRGRR